MSLFVFTLKQLWMLLLIRTRKYVMRAAANQARKIWKIYFSSARFLAKGIITYGEALGGWFFHARKFDWKMSSAQKTSLPVWLLMNTLKCQLNGGCLIKQISEI